MASTHGIPELLTVSEAAAACRTTPATVRHWVATDQLPSFKVGRRRLIARADLEAFIAAGRRAAGGVR